MADSTKTADSARWRPNPKYVVIAVLLMVLVGLHAWDRHRPTAVGDFIHKNRIQAVVLSNDRVYFGRLKESGPRYLKLAHAHYLKQEQGTDKDKKPTVVQKVVRISEELQHPRTTILLNRDNVIAIEELGPNSSVAQIVRNHDVTSEE
jgi:hypothetical protein